VLDLRPARAEIGFGARPAVAARSLIDLALLLGGRLLIVASSIRWCPG
jgi:hypothetical protein